MKPEQIRVGQTYFDGKAGLRRIIGEGDAYRLYEGQHNTDCVGYENLGPRRADHQQATRLSVAQWARLEVPADRVDALAEVLIARTLKGRLKDTEWAVLHCLETAQAGRPHAQKLTASQRKVAQRLADQNLVILAGEGQMARLAPRGEQVLSGRRQGSIPLPTGISLAASLNGEERKLLAQIVDRGSLHLQAQPPMVRNRLEELQRMGAIWFRQDVGHSEIMAELTSEGMKWHQEVNAIPLVATPAKSAPASRPRLRR